MKTGSRPQYYRIRRMVQMVREGAETGSLPNSSDFMNEFEVSRRTVARDLDFLRDEERAPLAYDDARHGFRLTDETYTLPPVRISRKEAFSFGLARKLLAHYEGTPLHLDMRSMSASCRRTGYASTRRCGRNWRASSSGARRSGRRTRPSTGGYPSTNCTRTTSSPTTGTGI